MADEGDAEGGGTGGLSEDAVQVFFVPWCMHVYIWCMHAYIFEVRIVTEMFSKCRRKDRQKGRTG